jgi:hypothetical protein
MTIAKSQMRQHGAFTILIPGLHGGAAPGLVQVLGGPLTRPTTARLVGKPETDEIVILTYSTGSHIWAATVTHLRITLGASISIRAGSVKDGTPSVRLHKMSGKVSFRLIQPGQVR